MNTSPDQTPAIVIDVSDPDAMELWRTVMQIAGAFEDVETRWCVVGGLMVALFAIEAGQLQRPTTDIDILGAIDLANCR